MPDLPSDRVDRSASVARLLESEWSDEFGDALAEDLDAALGLALARAVSLGWIESSESIEGPLQAAEAFLDGHIGGGDDGD